MHSHRFRSRYSKLALTSALSLFLMACQKEPIRKPASAFLKSWFNYQYGSYWVLKDSSTGTIDSIVSRGALSRYSESGKYSNESMHLSLPAYGPGDTMPKNYWSIIIQKQIPVQPEKGDLAEIRFGIGNASVDYSPLLTDPFLPQTSAPIGRRPLLLTISQYPAFEINGRVFDSVYELKYTFPGETREEYFYLNRAIGFIKIVQNNHVVKRTTVLERWSVQHE